MEMMAMATCGADDRCEDLSGDLAHSRQGEERLRQELGRMARRFCRHPEDVTRLIDRTLDEAGLPGGTLEGWAALEAEAATMPSLLSAMRRVMLAPSLAEDGGDEALRSHGPSLLT
ncbi:hypothetical protein BTR14_07205 [Rhizobium rhizosphaerae]|uniref:Uncharacterized protein n=2 Tax=Xaviernesmea rhizosphaerae TaxID=1672749 RepID=A0ABX3PGQ4_9HYPH|nr:hypothetical protein BTR14_07205 [Xaviernesmea rhizosphaerae]